MVANRQPVLETEEGRFQFDVNFQKALLRLLCEDFSFSIRACPHLKPEYFDHEILGWVFACITRHIEHYGAPPSVETLQQIVSQIDPGIVHLYTTVVDQIKQSSLRDEAWLKDQVLDFVKRNLFVRAVQESRVLYNTGNATKAYDIMHDQMGEIDRTVWEPEDRSNYTEELDHRLSENRKLAMEGDAIPTGFPSLDHILNGGLHVGELGVWLAYAKVGKALRDDQLVRTPTGWTPIAKLRVGDAVIGGSTGKLQKVLGVFPQGVQEMFDVQFSDKSSVVASGDHVWTVQTRLSEQLKTNRWKQVKTSELPRAREQYPSAWIPSPPFVEGQGNPLQIDPYLLGLLLGDGSFREATIKFHNPEKDLLEAVTRLLPIGDNAIWHDYADHCTTISITTPGPERSRVAKELARLGLMGLKSPDKFIPELIFYSDPEVRLGVLSGLCDTDGYVQHTGCSIEFSSASEKMASGVLDLAHSLGGYGVLKPKVVEGVTYWIVHFTLLNGTPLPVRSKKHTKKTLLRKTNKRRHVSAVVPMDNAPCTCIAVDDPEGLFITNDYIVTHNSTMLLQHGMAAVKRLVPTLHIVLEGSRRMIENRYDAAFTGELYAHIKNGQMDPHTYRAIHQEFQWLKSLLYIRSFVDKWDVNILDIEQELNILKKSKGFKPKLLVVDYADLMTGRDKKLYRTETESQRAAYRDCKRLTGRGYAMWTASQSTRPKSEDHSTAHKLTSSNAADTYEKVRACDFWGSLNQTTEEKGPYQKEINGFNCIRAYAEMYRDNAADQTMVWASDPSHMRIWEHPGLKSVSTQESSDAPATGPVQQSAF